MLVTGNVSRQDERFVLVAGNWDVEVHLNSRGSFVGHNRHGDCTRSECRIAHVLQNFRELAYEITQGVLVEVGVVATYANTHNLVFLVRGLPEIPAVRQGTVGVACVVAVTSNNGSTQTSGPTDSAQVVGYRGSCRCLVGTNCHRRVAQQVATKGEGTQLGTPWASRNSSSNHHLGQFLTHDVCTSRARVQTIVHCHQLTVIRVVVAQGEVSERICVIGCRTEWINPIGAEKIVVDINQPDVGIDTRCYPCTKTVIHLDQALANNVHLSQRVPYEVVSTARRNGQKENPFAILGHVSCSNLDVLQNFSSRTIVRQIVGATQHYHNVKAIDVCQSCIHWALPERTAIQRIIQLFPPVANLCASNGKVQSVLLTLNIGSNPRFQCQATIENMVSMGVVPTDASTPVLVHAILRCNVGGVVVSDRVTNESNSTAREGNSRILR